jgi:hypothetical protein
MKMWFAGFLFTTAYIGYFDGKSGLWKCIGTLLLTLFFWPVILGLEARELVNANTPAHGAAKGNP